MKKQKAPPSVADINVTPMVDVMLVLLIIFMVITPMLTKGVSGGTGEGQESDRDAGRRQGRRDSDRGHARWRGLPEPRQQADAPRTICPARSAIC